jgi:hypothetical protein
MVTFSTRNTPGELKKKLKTRDPPRWNNFDLEDNLVISKEENENESYICDKCGFQLGHIKGDDDNMLWCSKCMCYYSPEIDDVKKSVPFEIPADVHDITPAITSVDYTLGDTDRVSIRHELTPKGSFTEIQKKGLRLTSYKENNP